VRERDDIRRAREELVELEEARLRISSEVMRGNPEALAEDRRLENRIEELARWLVRVKRKDSEEETPSWARLFFYRLHRTIVLIHERRIDGW
jgi:hypothetical protein